LEQCWSRTPAWSDKKKGEEAILPPWRRSQDYDRAGGEDSRGESARTVVEAELENKHGKTTWEVEVLGADGKSLKSAVDAVTGEVIGTEPKTRRTRKRRGKKGK